MEYWNNPKIQYSQTVLPYPVDNDPIRASSHSGKHVLFYDPGVHKARIHYNTSTQDQCDWLNTSDIWQDPFRVASVVKLNIYVEDIKRQGVVKPMLLYYDGNEKFGGHTGENRMRASELLPELEFFESFITTHADHADQFKHLPLIENFEQWCEILRTPVGTQHSFTLTDPAAPYGIYWFEYSSDRTRAVTPDYDWCETVFSNYLKSNNVIFTPEWFLKKIDWNIYE